MFYNITSDVLIKDIHFLNIYCSKSYYLIPLHYAYQCNVTLSLYAVFKVHLFLTVLSVITYAKIFYGTFVYLITGKDQISETALPCWLGWHER